MTTLAELEARFLSEEPETRRLVVRELARADAPGSAALFSRALGDQDWRVRKEAAIVAKELAPRAAILEHLFAALDRKDDIGLRNAAVEALGSLGQDGVAVAVRAFGALDADGRKLAIEVLASLSTDQADDLAFDTIARALDDVDDNVRVAGAEALGRANAAKNKAIARLVASLEGARAAADLKLACLRSLDQLEAEIAIEAIEPHLSDALLRPAATRLLARAPAPRATMLAASALSDPSRTVAREAARALRVRIERIDDAELAIVERTLSPSRKGLARVRTLTRTEESTDVREGALLALALVRDPDDAPLFVDALADDSVAEIAEHALRLYGQSDTLLTATKTAAPPARGAAISVVPQVSRDGDVLAVSILRDALTASEPDVVVAALRSLAHVGQAEDLARVSALATRENVSISIAASHAIAALAEKWPDAALAAWRAIAGDARSSLEGCVLASSRSDDDPRSRVAYLVRGAGHPDPRVRSAAIDGLGGFTSEPDAKIAVSFAVADEEPSVALSAVRSLAALGDDAALSQVLAKSRDATLVSAAFDALCKFSEGRAELALRGLKERLARETDDTMRAAIAFTLSRVDEDK